MNSLIKSFPQPLSHEDEIFLFKKYKEENCLKSVEKIVLHNLRFVAFISKNYHCDGADENDLFQQGVIGVMKAIKGFDVNKKIRFISYAVKYIKSEIINYVHSNFGIVKSITTKPRKKIFNNIYKFDTKLDTMSTDEIDIMSKSLNVSEKEIRDIEFEFSHQDVSTQSIIRLNNDLDFTLEETLIHPDTTNYLTLREYDDNMLLLNKAVETLEGRDKEIFNDRRLLETPYTLSELSNKYNISKERIRQIEERAFNKVKNEVIQYN